LLLGHLPLFFGLLCAFVFWIVVGLETAAHSQLIHWSSQGQLEYGPATIMTDTFLEQETF
jgi:hypothetical protein